jgi:predicted RNA-binding protein YlxR (DUF448 family)
LRAPIRTCIGCRKTDEQGKLVRIVLDGAGRVKVDRHRRMAGRGAWLHDARACVEKAVEGHGLSRAFKRKTQPLEVGGLWDQMVGQQG